MRTRDKLLSIVICVALVVSISSILLLNDPGRPRSPSFPMDSAERLSVDQLAVKDADGIILPTWMPGKLQLREVYFAGSAMLVYSAEDVKDYRDDDVSIAISKTEYTPTEEQLKQTSGELLEINGITVDFFENPAPGPDHIERGIKPIKAYFYHNGFRYAITGDKAKVTRADMLKIIESMTPIGTETLRKAN